jgi:cytochrome b
MHNGAVTHNSNIEPAIVRGPPNIWIPGLYFLHVFCSALIWWDVLQEVVAQWAHARIGVVVSLALAFDLVWGQDAVQGARRANKPTTVELQAQLCGFVRSSQPRSPALRNTTPATP